MADFAMMIIEPPPLLFNLQSDPIDYPAVIIPLTQLDNFPPRISLVSPTPGTIIGKYTPLTFRLTDDNNAWSLRELWISFDAAATYELVWDGTSFKGWYADGSSLVALSDGWDISIVREPGWPKGVSLALRASVVDANGRVVVVSA